MLQVLQLAGLQASRPQLHIPLLGQQANLPLRAGLQPQLGQHHSQQARRLQLLILQVGQHHSQRPRHVQQQQHIRQLGQLVIQPPQAGAQQRLGPRRSQLVGRLQQLGKQAKP